MCLRGHSSLLEHVTNCHQVQQDSISIQENSRDTPVPGGIILTLFLSFNVFIWFITCIFFIIHFNSALIMISVLFIPVFLDLVLHFYS